MSYLEMLVDATERARERFYRQLEGLTDVDINTFPTPEQAPMIKSIAWLLWHTALEMDEQISNLKGTASLWELEYYDKFGFDLPKDNDGWNHTPEQATKVNANVELLKEYYDEATELTIAYLNSLDEDSLNDVIDTSWNPPVTRQVRIVSVIDDAIMHSGQAVYTRRLLGFEG